MLVVPAPTSAHVSSSAPGDVRIAPGRFDTVRIGDSLESAAESGYFALDVKTASCGTRAIWPTKPWRKSIDVYQGYEDETEGTVGTIGVFGDGISTKEGIGIGATVADLEAAYGDRLHRPPPERLRPVGLLHPHQPPLARLPDGRRRPRRPAHERRGGHLHRDHEGSPSRPATATGADLISRLPTASGVILLQLPGWSRLRRAARRLSSVGRASHS